MGNLSKKDIADISFDGVLILSISAEKAVRNGLSRRRGVPNRVVPERGRPSGGRNGCGHRHQSGVKYRPSEHDTGFIGA